MKESHIAIALVLAGASFVVCIRSCTGPSQVAKAPTPPAQATAQGTRLKPQGVLAKQPAAVEPEATAHYTKADERESNRRGQPGVATNAAKELPTRTTESVNQGNQSQMVSRRSQEKQLAGPELCEQLFGTLMIKLTVTPSSSIKKIVADRYSFELRSAELSVADWNKAISEKRWLDALGMITGKPLKTFPTVYELHEFRNRLLRKEFTAFVKTKADLSQTHPISLSEIVQLRMGFDLRLYVDGKSLACSNVGNVGNLPFFQRVGQPPEYWPRWTRHPDGIGWYIPWFCADGEVIIVPGRRRNKVGDSGFSPSVPDTDPAVTIWSEVQKRIDEAGGPLFTLNEDGIVQMLQKRIKLAELTKDEAIAALDKACLERHRARRRVALAQ